MKTIYREKCKKMKVLLVAMPDTASSFDKVMKIPNLGIASIAGNLDDCQVRVLDLVLKTKRITYFLKEQLRSFKPDIVGLSAMTFQYPSALKVAKIIKEENPGITIALGGYHATLNYKEIAESRDGKLLDFIIRGEGERAFNRLIRALQGKDQKEPIEGLSYKTGEKSLFSHNPSAPVLDLDKINLPSRESRFLKPFSFFGKNFEVLETSRGCYMGCKFCSINQMYGRSFRVYPISRVLEDVRRIREMGIRGVMIVDDNINLERKRFKELLSAIIDEGLNDMEYVTQASTYGIDSEIADLMKKAGFSIVFLGIENGIENNLNFLEKKGGSDEARRAVESLRKSQIAVVGGFILGNPDDGKWEIRESFRFISSLNLDHAIIWCLTPYPGTKLRKEMMEEGLIINLSDYSRYNGFICNVRTRKLSQRELNGLISIESLRYYLNPATILKSRLWKERARSLPSFFSNSLEYFTNIFTCRVFFSRHRF